MHIAILAKKGGVGKSTLSLLLTQALRQAGHAVAVHDWDAQGTLTKSFSIIGQPAPVAAPSITIYDTPPSLEHPATATAVRNASLCLIVSSPSPADIWEADEAVRFASTLNPASPVRVVFNKVRRNTLLGKLIDGPNQILSVPVLPVSLSNRECFQHCLAQGWKALDGGARQEVLQLALAVLSASKSQ